MSQPTSPDSSVHKGAAGASAPAASTRPVAAGLVSGAWAYAATGWRVFPAAGIVDGRCSCRRATCDHPGKHPLTRHGLHDATTDQDQLSAWWRRWPEANVAVATGDVVVVDVDPEAGGWDSMALLVDGGFRLPPTATVVTGSGGVHLYYRAPEWELRNTVAALPGVSDALPGIDLRARGGYVIAPPSRHVAGRCYRWVPRSGAPVPAPAWLKPRPQPTVSRSSPMSLPASGSRRYGEAALDAEVARVRSAPVGTRNHALNRAAFSLGQLVAAGHLAAAPTRGALLEVAIVAGLSEREADRTIASGLRAGMEVPRTSPSPLSRAPG